MLIISDESLMAFSFVFDDHLSFHLAKWVSLNNQVRGPSNISWICMKMWQRNSLLLLVNTYSLRMWIFQDAINKY